MPHQQYLFCNFYIFGDKLTFLGFVLIAVYTMVGLTVRGTFHHVKVIEQVKHMIYNIWLHDNYSHDSWFHNKYTDHIYTTGLVDYLKHGNNLIGTTMVFKIRIQKSITDPKVP